MDAVRIVSMTMRSSPSDASALTDLTTGASDSSRRPLMPRWMPFLLVLDGLAPVNRCCAPAERRGQCGNLPRPHLGDCLNGYDFALGQMRLALLQMPQGRCKQQPQPCPPHLGIQTVQSPT